MASLVGGGALSSCSCPIDCCHSIWLRLAPGDPWEFVLWLSGMSGLAALAPSRIDTHARTMGQHFMGTAYLSFGSHGPRTSASQRPPEAQTHVHSDDKHLTQRGIHASGERPASALQK